MSTSEILNLEIFVTRINTPFLPSTINPILPAVSPVNPSCSLKKAPTLIQRGLFQRIRGAEMHLEMVQRV